MNSISIILMIILLPAASFAAKTFTLKADLNSDKITETITVTTIDEGKDSYILRVGKLSIRGHVFEKVDEVKIVDIDKNDKFKEIQVAAYGPSDDFNSDIYYYDGYSIKKMGSTAGFTYSGDGILYDKNWMGFWLKTEKVVLVKQSHMLKWIKQPFYNVGKKTFVNSSLNIYQETDCKHVLAKLGVKSKIDIILASIPSLENGKDPYYKIVYLVKTEKGLLGWINYDSLKSLELNWAD